jgi:hypothetical protein
MYLSWKKEDLEELGKDFLTPFRNEREEEESREELVADCTLLAVWLICLYKILKALSVI